MDEAGYLRDLVVLFAAAIGVLALARRSRLPAVVGYLLTGMLAGPYGFALVEEPARVEQLAELGVVFLLFVIGLELTAEHLTDLRRALLLGGSLQLVVTVSAVVGIALLLGRRLPEGVFLGFVVTLSSTAVVLRLFLDRGELEAPHARVATGILLFQDLLIAPMVLALPLLGGGSGATALGLARQLGGGLLIVAVVFSLGRFVLPRLLHALVQSGTPELLLLLALLVCLGGALLTRSVGLSMALGGFLGGVALAGSDYRHQALAEIAPFRAVFTSVFFVSVGMLLDLPFALEGLIRILGLSAAIVLLKVAILFWVIRWLGFALRTAVCGALAMAQLGEFSFVLLQAGQRQGLVEPAVYQLLIAVTVLTLLATPLLVSTAPLLVGLAHRRLGGLLESGPGAEAQGTAVRVVIAGYGLNGRNLARVLRSARVPYLVVDLDGWRVNEAKVAGEPILYGDITRREIQESCRVPSASMLVVAVSDSAASRQAVQLARSSSPELYILARAHRREEVEQLQAAGASEVVSEEFETSIEIVTRVLTRLHVPRNVIRTQARLLRADGYEMLRTQAPVTGVKEALVDALAAGATDVFRLTAEHGAVGCSLRDLELRRRTGASIIAVVRGDETLTNPSPDLPLLAGDTLVLVGSHAEVEAAFGLLDQSARPEPLPGAATAERSPAGSG